jgi:hypothetical protein
MAIIELWLLRVLGYGVLLAAFGVACVVGYEHFVHPAPPAVESAAPAVIQSDGSLVAARQQTTPDQKPANALPKGAKLLRTESVTVRANTAKGAPVAPPVTLKMDYDQLKDGTDRVVVSSPDGKIEGALDIPVAPPAPEPPKWAAGVGYGIPMGGVRSESAWVERDLPLHLRVGLDLVHVTAPRQASNMVMARLGVTF